MIRRPEVVVELPRQLQDGPVGYINTFIAVAQDCQATTGEVPPERQGGLTVAAVQDAMLAAAPGRWTQKDVLLGSSPQVRDRGISETGPGRLRNEHLSQPRACLRASALAKTFGWGLYFDAHGRITCACAVACHRCNGGLSR